MAWNAPKNKATRALYISIVKYQNGEKYYTVDYKIVEAKQNKWLKPQEKAYFKDCARLLCN